MKKLLIMMAVSTMVCTAMAADRYQVAGNYVNIFGYNWDVSGDMNIMTANANNTYSLPFYVNSDRKNIELKVVKNQTEWIGDENGHNIVFDVTDAGYFNVVYHPDTRKIEVLGNYVKLKTKLEYSAVYAVGDGQGNWLNGKVWNPAAESNKMTKIAEGVYQITYKDVEACDYHLVKFALDGAWTNNFGGTGYDNAESGTEYDAVFNGNNIYLEVPDDEATITLRLDLRNFDYTTKSGAKYTIYINEAPDPVAVKGDVNGDGSVNAGDVSAIYNMMLGVTEPDPTCADLNDDSNINAADVSALYSIMLAE